MSTSTASSLYEKHKEAIEKAIAAVHSREFFAHYPESPSPRVYGEYANTLGQEAFDGQLNRGYQLLQDSDQALAAGEESPYTLENLGISYPAFKDASTYVKKAKEAFGAWRKADVYTRAGVLMESLEGVKNRFFELAYATMHTTGQSFVMSFQASGPHANDRALEAIALGVHELTRFPAGEVDWVKPMGKFDIKMRKHFRNVPKGIGLTIGCSTFPVWNTVPAIYADLIKGNPCIVKPHPKAIYPIALVVDELQKALKAAGFDPHTVQLAADTAEHPVTKLLAEHPEVKLIDFTGSSVFGNYVENLPGKTVFTEKTGVNSVIIESADDMRAMMGNLAFAVSLYSGQMCTCPQNIFIPKEGIKVAGEQVSYEEVVQAFIKSIRFVATHEKMGPGTLGAIQSALTQQRVQNAAHLGGKVLLEPMPIENPEFPKARMSTHLVMEVTPAQRDVFSQEMFGPILFVIPTESTAHSVQLAKELAAEEGAISCAAYSTDPETMDYIDEQMAEAATPVSFNFTGMFWVNQNAGFSDFHVTGGNPSGNASLTDPEFIRRRFTIVGSRVFVG